VYENEFVKVNGVWKIHKDHVYTTFFTTYDPGWAFDSRPTPKASPKIPPDLPPTVTYESLPEVYVPVFHYKNPVTGGETVAPPEVPIAPPLAPPDTPAPLAPEPVTPGVAPVVLPGAAPEPASFTVPVQPTKPPSKPHMPIESRNFMEKPSSGHDEPTAQTKVRASRRALNAS
jgi:hypothetical protein